MTMATTVVDVSDRNLDEIQVIEAPTVLEVIEMPMPAEAAVAATTWAPVASAGITRDVERNDCRAAGHSWTPPGSHDPLPGR
ncbi:hypothetical protein [Nonomuraea sp. SYSU D8015]|uniref:hypothetical protein n=1 Tax=Nonomuraea sp. SYSU D8015 TaxID=2593644 RepID=UPI0016604B3E|nr:hypothetical protein [Nonomuraea sp. SYSU D8015]